MSQAEIQILTNLSATVWLSNDNDGSIVVDEDAANVELQFSTVLRGPEGPPGPPGAATIAGYGVQANDLQAGDHLEFLGTHWANVRKTVLTDGGNF